MTTTIDDIDKKLLDIIQSNAKATYKEMEEEVGLKTSAIRARIDKLKERGIIKKYLKLIDCRQLGYQEMVIASLRVNSRKPLGDFKEKIEQMIKIKYAYIITGEYPLLLMFKCLNHDDAMQQIEKLRNLPGIEEIKTQIVLDRIKEDPTIIIPK